MLELFPGAVYENAFGTVAVRRDGDEFEVTTFRIEHEYADFRRPHRRGVRRRHRDRPRPARLHGERDRLGPTRPRRRAAVLVDPFDGSATSSAASCARSATRARGSGGCAADGPRGPARGDARASRSSRRRGGDRRQRRRSSPTSRGSGSRAELDRLLAAPRPSVGLRLAAETALLAVISPELAAQRGDAAEQGRRRGPVGPHAADRRCRAGGAPVVRLAALLHDIGKPATARRRPLPPPRRRSARGWRVELLDRLRSRAPTVERVVHLVRHHMFTVEPDCDATPRSGGSSSGSARRTSTRCSRCGGRTTSAAACRRMSPALARVPGPDRRRARRRGGARPLRARDRRHGPHARAGARGRARGWAGCSTTLVERVIDDPALNERAYTAAARTGHACGHAGRGPPGDRAAAPGGAGARRGPGGPGRAPLPPGRRRRPAQLDRGRGAGARRARARRRRRGVAGGEAGARDRPRERRRAADGRAVRGGLAAQRRRAPRPASRDPVGPGGAGCGGG